MQFYEITAKEALDRAATNESGLTEIEAQRRLLEYGPNTLKKQKKAGPFVLFLKQFNNVLIYILLAATIISWLLNEKIDAYVIFIIIIFNAVFGFIQEYKAERAIENLKKLTALSAKVIRNGILKTISPVKLVPGDIVVLEAGDKIPADLRIIQASNLQSDESPLTGESFPVNKTINPLTSSTPLAERRNMLYSSTSVVRGTAHGIVVSTGMKTEIGKIAQMVQDADHPETPLEKKIKEFSRFLEYIIAGICVLIFGAGMMRGGNLFEMFLTTIALAVAAIPEGLPAIVTISLAVGVQKMVKRNALIRRLNAIETLGSITVICTDKTGTITKNEMTVTKVYANQKFYTVTGKGYNSVGNFLDFSEKIVNPQKEFSKMLEVAITCSNATESTGDPTERALLFAALKGKSSRLERKDEIPFDSDAKFMVTIHDGFSYYKGAPEVILDLCTHIIIDNEKRRILEKDKSNIINSNYSMASDALRVLAMAYQEGNDMHFLGLMGMIDPPKEGVAESILKCSEAGIRTIMITGDHPTTAEAIAEKIGLKGEALSGSELEKIDDAELKNVVYNYSIYARATSSQKVRILNALQSNGEIVAMTGDGVNDAPAIKSSDVGIAMSLRGTDISRDSSDMVLADDNFSSIVNSIEEGRIIYENIKKFILYLISANIAEVAIILFAIIIGLPLPLLPLQILWINLMTDSWPALALAVDPPSSNIMKNKPRKTDGSILHGSIGFILFRGLIGAAITLGIFVWGLHSSLPIEEARTYTLTALILFELLVVYSVKSSRPFGNMFNNKWLNLSVILSLLLQLLVIYSPLNKFFKLVPLSPNEWLSMFVISLFGFILMECSKLIKTKNKAPDGQLI